MTIDWLDVGFNIVIGFVILGMLCYVGWNVKRMIQKQMKKDKKLEDDLDDLPRI